MPATIIPSCHQQQSHGGIMNVGPLCNRSSALVVLVFILFFVLCPVIVEPSSPVESAPPHTGKQESPGSVARIGVNHGNFTGGRVIPTGPEADPHNPAPDDTPLHSAIRICDRPAIERLLANGASLKAINKRYETPLAVAIRLEQNDIVKLLITAGAEINPKYDLPVLKNRPRLKTGSAMGFRGYGPNGQKSSPVDPSPISDDESYIRFYYPPPDYLDLAIQQKNEALALLLLENGVTVNESEFSVTGSPFLLRRILENEMYCLADKILARAGQNQPRIADTLLASAIDSSEPIKATLLKLLIDHGANLETPDREGLTPLMRAAKNGNLKTATILLDSGAQIDAISPGKNSQLESRTALTMAMLGAVENQSDSERKIAVAKLLITRGATLNNITVFRILARVANHPDLIELAYNHGINLELQDTSGNTLLKLALDNRNFDLADFLLKRGANINTPAIDMVDYLFRMDASAVDILLANDFDLNQEKNGRVAYSTNTPLGYVCEKGDTANVERFIKHGANVNLRNSRGETPLFAAVSSGKLDIVILLCEAGAEINYEDSKEGINAFILASTREQKEIADYLRLHGADTSGLISDQITLAQLKKVGLLPLEAEWLTKQHLALIKAMLKSELGSDSLEKLNHPDPRFASPDQAWEIYKKALIDGDLELAAQCHLPNNDYIRTYRELGRERTAEIGKNFRPIKNVYCQDKRCKYRILRTINGYDITFYIYFVDIFGEWKIEQY